MNREKNFYYLFGGDENLDWRKNQADENLDRYYLSINQDKHFIKMS